MLIASVYRTMNNPLAPWLLGVVFLFWLQNTAVSQVVINEFMASNSLAFEDPDFQNTGDWVELFNAGSEDVDLSGWHLTDNWNDATKWTIPDGIQLEAEGFLLVWCDEANTTGNELHCSYRLSSEGEELALFTPELVAVDSLVFGAQESDVSYGRSNDGLAQWSWFSSGTPGTSNNDAESFEGITFAVPHFSEEGGFYDEAFQVALSSIVGEVRFTMDGRSPEWSDSLYTLPLEVEGDAFIRARVFEEGHIPGPVVTHSYFMDTELADRTLPVFSLVTDPDHFWDADTGIYVQDFKPEWEWPVNVEFFENDGNNEAVFNERAGVKVNGQNSWVLPQKMLGIYFRGGYGSGTLDYPLFHDRDRSRFDNFVLRASGSDWASTLMRDGLSQSLPQENTHVDHQGYRPSIVFVNGEYMGIHNIRSRVDEEFVTENHGVEPNALDMIADHGVVEEGIDSAFWAMDALFSADLNIQGNFDAVAAVVDMENFADYWSTEIWASNSSWGHNVIQWKPREYGKWQYVFTDLDRGFSGSTNDAINAFVQPQNNNYDYARTWIRHALQNSVYEGYFAQRMADHLHTSFHPERVHRVIDAWESRIAAEVPYHVERWSGTTSSYGDGIENVEFWEDEVSELRVFASERSPFLLGDMANQFNLNAIVTLQTDNFPPGAGNIRLNDFRMPDSPWVGPYFDGMPFILSAEPLPGFDFVGWSEIGLVDIIPEGADWQYQDTGEDLGSAWCTLGFDASGWSSGTAELGYGDGDEVTEVSFGDDDQNKHITTYFRHAFDVDADLAESVNGVIHLRRDDGAVVYLNGQELFRDNMPEGEIASTTFALEATAGAAESNWIAHPIELSFLPGANVIAVEIHQVSSTSSDISFDLRLSTSAPLEAILSSDNPLELSLVGDAGYFARYEATGECALPETIAEDLTLTADCSPYLATGTSVVQAGATLTLEPGVEIWFPTDARLLVRGQLLAEGTTDAPVGFRLNPNSEAPWGNIQFDASSESNVIRHAFIEGASEGDHPVHDRAAVAAWFSTVTLDHVTLTANFSNPVYAEYSDIQLINCSLHSDVTGDLINVRHGSALIDSCVFVGNDAPDTDAIDYDVVANGIVRNTLIHSFRGSNSDGIDLGEGSQNILIEGGVIHHCTDKGVSIGQGSDAIIREMTISQCALGVAMKDLGAASIDYTTFYGNQYGISVYEKNPGMGGGTVTAQRSIFSNSSHSPVFQDSVSTAWVMEAIYDSDTLSFDDVVMANPLFAHPDAFYFGLLEGSPAADAGGPGDNYGASFPWAIPWSITERDMAIVEFGYAGIEHPNREWIKVQNEGGQPVNLQGYRLEDAVSWTCVDALWVDPGESVWIVKDVAFFEESFEQVVAWDAGQLANEGERILLKDAAGIVVDFVRYGIEAPWPVPVAGAEALVRISPWLDNHFASSWMLAELDDVPLEVAATSIWSMYPNPAKNRIHMHFDEVLSEPLDVQLFSATGQCLQEWRLSARGNDITLDVSNFPQGMYLLRVDGVSRLIQLL
ncbi:CotH kinase family protein [Flavobacteriales bacterium]|nr:CotH kinase family protein [Flavobacteriales bacterium]